MVILCYLQAKEGPNIGYRKRMHQYRKDYWLSELEEKQFACQVKNVLKTGKLSKVEIDRQIKRQIKQTVTIHMLNLSLQVKRLNLKRQIKHVDSVEVETEELDRAEEKIVTQSDDNVLLQEFTAGASGYVENYTDIIE